MIYEHNTHQKTDSSSSSKPAQPSRKSSHLAANPTQQPAWTKAMGTHPPGAVASQAASVIAGAQAISVQRKAADDKRSSSPEINVPQKFAKEKEEPNHRLYSVTNFDIGSSEISADIRRELDVLVSFLLTVNDERPQVRITGFASRSVLEGKGGFAYGWKRAHSVRDYFVEHRIPGSWVIANTMGDVFSPPPTASPLAKADSRKVTIEITLTGRPKPPEKPTWPSPEENAEFEATAAGAKPSGIWPSGERRRFLTGSERAAAVSVFGDSIKLDRVLLVDSPFMTRDPRPWRHERYARTVPETIYVLKSEDFDKMPLPFLIHELTHVWQYQHGVSVRKTAWTAMQGPKMYPYDGEKGLRDALRTGKKFTDFNTEQQGSILRDYYIRSFITHEDVSAWQPFVDQVRAAK